MELTLKWIDSMVSEDKIIEELANQNLHDALKKLNKMAKRRDSKAKDLIRKFVEAKL